MRYKSKETMDTIIHAIEEHFFSYNESPSIAEIARVVGLSKSGVYKYLKEMDEKGLITYTGDSIHTPVTEKINTDLNYTPVLGSVACGTPQLSEENFEEYVALPTSLFGNGDFFILRAYGESMIDAGIEPGDMVVVRKQNTAKDGDIVVALVNNENTLKRYYIDEITHRVILHPENKNMADIYPTNCCIQGVACHVIKAL